MDDGRQCLIIGIESNCSLSLSIEFTLLDGEFYSYLDYDESKEMIEVKGHDCQIERSAKGKITGTVNVNKKQLSDFLLRLSSHKLAFDFVEYTGKRSFNFSV
jgi:hypothetical protein